MWLKLLLGGIFLYIIRYLLAYKWTMSLKGKLIVITGCDTGFGNFTAKALDKMGAIVFATCLDKNLAQLLKKETSNNCHIIMMDITKTKDIENAYEEVKKYCEESKINVWGIVNNAGIGARDPFECQTKELFDKILDINLLGLINFTRQMLPLMRINNLTKYGPPSSIFNYGNNGRIVNIASIAGRASSPFLSAYHASKWGNIGFSGAICIELLQLYNIMVSTVEPFFTNTPILGDFKDYNVNNSTWHNLPNKNEIFKVYSIEKWAKNVQLSHSKLKKIMSNNPYEVVDSIIASLSSHYPLHHYYPNWRALFIAYIPAIFILPSTLRSWIVNKAYAHDIDIVY